MREDRLPVAHRSGLGADAPAQLLGFRAAELRETGNDGVKLIDRPRLAPSEGKPSPSGRFAVAPIFAGHRSGEPTHATAALGRHPDEGVLADDGSTDETVSAAEIFPARPCARPLHCAPQQRHDRPARLAEGSLPGDGKRPGHAHRRVENAVSRRTGAGSSRRALTGWNRRQFRLSPANRSKRRLERDGIRPSSILRVRSIISPADGCSFRERKLQAKQLNG